MSLILIAILAIAVIAVVELIQSNAKNLTAWALLLVALVLYFR